MRRYLSVVLAAAFVVALAGVAFAQMGGGWMAGRMGPGQFTCPGMTAATQTAPAAVTEEKAKELATGYAEKYFKGYTVERVLPFAGRMGTAYQVELKGPKGETRILHVNPWGGVRPFGPLAATE